MILKPGDKLERPTDKKGTVLRLGGYLLGRRSFFLAAIGMNLAANLLALAGPMLSGYAVDAISLGKGRVDFGRVFFFSAWMAACYAGSAVLVYLLHVLMITVSRKVAYEMRRDVFSHLLGLPAGYFDTRQTGDILSRISYDIDTVNASLSDDVIQLMTTIITVAGSFIMMVMVSAKLVLIFVVTVPLSLCMTRFIVRKTRPLFRERSKALGSLNGYGEEQITGQKTIKAYHQEENRGKTFDRFNHEATEAFYRSEYYSSCTGPLVNFVNNLSLTLISVFGAVLFLTGQMGLGQISSFILYSRKFSGPINETANILSELQSALAAAERVFQILDEEPEAPDEEGAAELGRAAGEVEFSRVSFGYEPGKPILKDLSFLAEPGKMIAVAGPTGAGKTTLINLLMRFYDADRGQVSVDGRDARLWTRASLRKAYAMVLQDTWLFTGTVMENLSYGCREITREQVINAAKVAKIHGFIQSLPEGYDTVLSEEGANISKGQKQLLTIARAMLLDARMLILDEATSNVDTRTERQIQAAMRRLMEGKTCFVIAHRLSTIRNADRILVIDQGRITEQGSHEELMAKDGCYRKMYEAQFI